MKEALASRSPLLPLQRHDPGDVDPLAGPVQIVVALEVHPVLGAVAEEAREAHGHVGGHGHIAPHEVHELGARHFYVVRQRASAHVERIKVEVLEDAPRV